MKVYLDNNSTTPLLKEVKEKIIEILDVFDCNGDEIEVDITDDEIINLIQINITKRFPKRKRRFCINLPFNTSHVYGILHTMSNE